MKKNISIGIAISIFLFSGSILFTTNGFRQTISTGICLVTDNRVIVVVDDIPIIISNQGTNADLFSGIRTGDKVIMTHDGVAESYPAQTEIYKLLKIDTDRTDEVSTKIITELGAMGYTVMQ